MNKRIVAIPVDGRAAVREQVKMLVAISGWELIVPDITALGDFRIPADRDALSAWLLTQAANADGIVISLDMLVYGGLVPSRFIEDDVDTLKGYLLVIETIKTRYPHLPVYAFAATMRMSNNNINEEEKSYWSLYGELIWQWSFYSDRFAVNNAAADQSLAQAAQQQIPETIQQDYLATRARNFAVTLEAIKLVESNKIDRLILPQDDTAGFGFNIAERRVLQSRISAGGLQSKILVYPGADEVIHTLCARLIAKQSLLPPCKFFLYCSDAAHFKLHHALYEDRPVSDSVLSQIESVGGVIVSRADDADIVIVVHTQGAAQGDWAMRKLLPQLIPITADWLRQLAVFHEAGKPIAVADLAFANGGDPAFMESVSTVIPLQELAAYAGWNTASNSIGSLVAQCVLAQRKLEADKFDDVDNKKLLCLRLLEDIQYQAVLRQTIRDQITESNLSAHDLQQTVARIFMTPANRWAESHRLAWRVESIFLPWNRTFEIGLNLIPVTAEAES